MLIRGLFAPVLAGGTFLFCVIPSAVLQHKSSRKLDLISLCTSGITLAIVLLAWALIEPLRQWIIFGK
jgi:hypothetical protein